MAQQIRHDNDALHLLQTPDADVKASVSIREANTRRVVDLTCASMSVLLLQ